MAPIPQHSPGLSVSGWLQQEGAPQGLLARIPIRLAGSRREQACRRPRVRWHPQEWQLCLHRLHGVLYSSHHLFVHAHFICVPGHQDDPPFANIGRRCLEKKPSRRPPQAARFPGDLVIFLSALSLLGLLWVCCFRVLLRSSQTKLAKALEDEIKLVKVLEEKTKLAEAALEDKNKLAETALEHRAKLAKALEDKTSVQREFISSLATHTQVTKKLAQNTLLLRATENHDKVGQEHIGVLQEGIKDYVRVHAEQADSIIFRDETIDRLSGENKALRDLLEAERRQRRD